MEAGRNSNQESNINPKISGKDPGAEAMISNLPISSSNNE